MDISNSSLEASHLIHKWEPGRKLDIATHAPQKWAHAIWLSGCISQRVLIDLIEVSRAIHKINQEKSVAPLWSLVLLKLGPVSNNEMDFYRLRRNKSETKTFPPLISKTPSLSTLGSKKHVTNLSPLDNIKVIWKKVLLCNVKMYHSIVFYTPPTWVTFSILFYSSLAVSIKMILLDCLYFLRQFFFIRD